MDSYHSSDGASALWPEINAHFLSLRGIPVNASAANATQFVYSQMLTGFDAITSCEIKDFYKFSMQLQIMDKNEITRPELYLLHQALSCWVSFKYEHARVILIEHIKKFPTDVMAVFIQHMLEFCTGKTTKLQESLEICDRYISASNALYPFYLSIKSFVQCENQLFDEALETGLEATRLSPTNIYGIHAVAHALHEQGNWQEICLFLNQKKDNWVNNAGMHMHVYWHLALAYKKINDTEKALEAFHSLYALKESPFAKQDLDAVAFLWRITLDQLEHPRFSEVWQRLAALWTGSVCVSTSYFHKLHAALAFAGAKQPFLISKLVAESDGFGVEELTHKVGLEVLKAILLFAQEKYTECFIKLNVTQNQWYLLGGSRAQREILFLTMEQAASLSHTGIQNENDCARKILSC